MTFKGPILDPLLGLYLFIFFILDSSGTVSRNSFFWKPLEESTPQKKYSKQHIYPSVYSLRLNLMLELGDWTRVNTTVTSFSRSRARKVTLRENASPSPRPGLETEDVCAAVWHNTWPFTHFCFITQRLTWCQWWEARVGSWCNHGVRACHAVQMLLMVPSCWEQLDRWRRWVPVPAALKYENSMSLCVREGWNSWLRRCIFRFAIKLLLQSPTTTTTTTKNSILTQTDKLKSAIVYGCAACLSVSFCSARLCCRARRPNPTVLH